MSGAVAAFRRLKEEITCPICLDIFREPRLLQCGHKFCRGCLVKTVREREGKLVVPCSLCFQPTPVPSNGVTGIRSAFYVEHLIEIYKDRKELGAGTEEEDFTSSEASSLRETDETSFSSSSLGNAQHHCSEHNKVLDLYCATCNKVFCYRCIVQGDHQGHSYNLHEVFLEKYRGEISSLLGPVKEQLAKMRKMSSVFDRAIESVTKQEAEIEANIKQITNELQEGLRKREAELVSQLKATTKRKMKDITCQKDKLVLAQERFERCQELAEKTLESADTTTTLQKKAEIVGKIQDLTATFQPDHFTLHVEADIKFCHSLDLLKMCQSHGEIIEKNQVDPSKCQVVGLEEEFNKIITGRQNSVTVQVSNFKHEPCDISAEKLECELISELTESLVSTVVERQREGQFLVFFQPQVKGRHALHVKIKGNRIQGSPYKLNVRIPVEKLDKPVLIMKDGMIKKPCGIALNRRGEVLVTNMVRHCVCIFSTSGKFKRSFGKLGHLHGEFNTPCAIAVDTKDNILVTDMLNHRVQKFTVEGRFVKLQKFNSPQFIAYNSINDRVYVIDCNHRIQILDTDLKFCGVFAKNGHFDTISGIAFDSFGNTFLVDRYNHKIEVFSPSGELMYTFGRRGEGWGDLLMPFRIFIDGKDMVYVSESDNHRLSVFTAAGEFVTALGRHRGAGRGEFKDPHGVAVDESGVVYVCDSLNNRIQVF